MGLDQYAYHKPSYTGKDEGVQFAYWRKHNRLQGWMENLWREQLAELDEDASLLNGDFNCVPVYLTEEDLDELEKAVTQRTLPETGGFFFGSDSYSEYKEDGLFEADMKFIEEAREFLKKGEEVYYSSWW
jgi:hypothetical protein